MMIGSDTGGTFTDLVTDDGRVLKVLSTRDDPGSAIREGLRRLDAAEVALLAHGTTVATNALLERRGSRVAVVTTEGFTDVIEIARQDRPSLYDLWADRPEPLVPRERRYGVAERVGADGHVLAGLPAGVPPVDDDVESIAVCLLHADLAPEHERELGERLAASGFDVSCSVDVSPEFREYERTVTTAANAYVRPVCRTYLRGLAEVADEVLVMTSAGGLVPVATAAELPVSLLLSGPAGGVAAAAAAAVANGFPDAVTVDMGGTSTDVCLVRGGVPEPAAERVVGGLPIRMPSLGVETIGAGGGSIASLDAGGALRVGPESAGADPGPVCYGRGGTRPTVTDANLVTGRLGDDPALADLGRLDIDAARRAFDLAGIDPEGVIRVVDASMVQALRSVTVARGVDPRSLALVAFGGAGPLHACALADALGVSTVLIPARAGVLSAVGILGASVRRDLVRSWPDPGDHHGLSEALARLAGEAADLLVGRSGVQTTTALDCRYEGQSHELSVPSVDDFHAEHERRNGYRRLDSPVEVVALRATATAEPMLSVGSLPAIERSGVIGPAVLVEPDCTIAVASGWRARPGAAGALVLERTP